MRQNITAPARGRLEIFMLLRARYPDAPNMRRQLQFAIAPQIDLFVKDMLGDYVYLASLQRPPAKEEANAKS